MKTNTSTFENLSDRPTTKYIRQLEWTTRQPTKPGYYWAIHSLKEEFPLPRIIQYCEYDIGGVSFPVMRKKEYYSMFFEKPIDISLYTHFMGPLEMPEVPK